MKKIFFFSAMLAWLALCFGSGCSGNQKIKEKLAMKGKPQYIIDVRSAEEFASGHVDGAILIPHTEIAQKIGTAVPDKNSFVVLYCRSGRRSGLSKKIMEDMGYKNVINLGSYADAVNALK